MLKKEFETRPLECALIFCLLALVCISFPVRFAAGAIGLLNALAIVRIVFGMAGVVCLIKAGFKDIFVFKKDFVKNIDIFIAALIVAMANFPVSSLLTGQSHITAKSGDIVSFIIYCFSIGFFEEMFFRGLIFTLLLNHFTKSSYTELKAVITSSVLFGVIHFVNLMSGSGFIYVLMQVGYSTLNGLMFAVLFYMTKSIILPVVCHTLFDIGGLMIDIIGQGEIWNVVSITVTAVSSVLAAVYITLRFFSHLKRQRNELDKDPSTDIT